jgi:hypothetical protein
MTAKVDPGPKPELVWLALARCHVDHRYQRTLESDRSQPAQAARTLDDSAGIKPPTLAQRMGRR